MQAPDWAPTEPLPLTGAEDPDEGAVMGGDEATVEAALATGLGEDAGPDATLETGTKTPPVLLDGAATEVAVEPEATEGDPPEDPPPFEPDEPPQPTGGAGFIFSWGAVTTGTSISTD